MNGCISWNRVKAWSSIQRKFQMISERRKFLSPFLTFAMSAVQIFNAKKPACKVLQYFKIVWVFFQLPFFLKDQNWGEGILPSRGSQPGVHQTQNLIFKCFSSLKSLLYRVTELPHLHTAVWGEYGCCCQLFKGEGQCWQLLMKMPGWPGKVPSCPHNFPRDRKPRTSWLIKAQSASKTQFPKIHTFCLQTCLFW